ncbi:MAG: protein kinase [Acidobacteriia bacterium]|nr:protein kinase [Terriglobia bacterium]
MSPGHSRMTLTSGTRLGPYEVLASLGAGGMGEVYRARDTRLDRVIALKVLPERMAKDPVALARFVREAKAVAALSHPNILAIYDFGCEQEVHFAAMELLEGETLKSRIQHVQLPWRKAAEIGIALADGLSAAHIKGIVHRDLKPDNIFLTSDGMVKILDFGLARMAPSAIPAGDETASLREDLETIPGTLMGTVRYMSPEQARGEPAGARSDIFSLGCILFEMAYGAHPFARNTHAETLAAILKEPPVQISGMTQSVPPEFEVLVAHCLEKNPDDRFHSARDLAFALKSMSGITGQVAVAAAPAKPRVKPRLAWILAALTVLLLALGSYLWFGRSGSIESLAVLPFVNVGGNPNVEYLSDGITEGIINNLAQLPNLGVASRSSVFRYKDKQGDPQQIAQQLKVGSILTGRLVVRGDTVSISAELVDAKTNRQIWGEQYDRKLADLLGVQSEITREISEKLRVRLTGEQETRLAKRQTQDSESYQLYLRGRYQWNKRTLDGMQQAIELFQQAIAKDSRYALAYAGLADAYILLADYNVLPAREVMPRAKEAATQALQIDDLLAEAHTSLGWVKLTHDWAWTDAEGEFKRALQLNSNYALAHEMYGEYLTLTGKLDEAALETQRALDLEPVSLPLNRAVASASYYAGHYDQAIEQSRKTLLLDPGFIGAHVLLGRAYQQKQAYPEAIAEFRKALELSEGDSNELAALAQAYALGGKPAEARKTLDELKERSTQTYVQPIWIAAILTALGEKDEAFQWLQKGYADRSSWVVYLRVDPLFTKLRSDPRFTDLAQRAGLP